MDKYQGHLFLDLDYLIEDFSKYIKIVVSPSIKGDKDCYPLYMNDIKNITRRIEGEEVEEVKSKENYDCLRTGDRNMTYYKYLNILSKRLLKIYNTYKSVEDELTPNHSYMNDIQDILDRINNWKERYNNFVNSVKPEINANIQKIKNNQKKLKNNINTAKLRSPLNRLSAASPYKKWWGARKNRSTRKRK